MGQSSKGGGLGKQYHKLMLGKVNQVGNDVVDHKTSRYQMYCRDSIIWERTRKRGFYVDVVGYFYRLYQEYGIMGGLLGKGKKWDCNSAPWKGQDEELFFLVQGVDQF